MARRKPDEEENADVLRSRERALAAYRKLGEQLYGIIQGPGEVPWNKRDMRRKLRYDRRRIEYMYPDIRQLELDTYRPSSPNLRSYIPKLFIVYSGGEGGGGVLTYPDGSREQHAEYYFTNKNDLRRIFATLAYYDKISPTETEVIVAGSAIPMATFIERLA